MGGLGEVGKNMYCVEHQDEIIIMDCGVRFPEDDLLGVDYVVPDYTYLSKNADKIKALIITHGHEDHIGGIPFFLKACPCKTIYAPRFAIALIEKKLDEHRMSRAVKLVEINGESRITTKFFHVGFFNTIHSIPDSLGLIVNTPNGTIVETGDFKFDLTPVGTNSDYQKMAYMGAIGTTLLMSDSTNSGVREFSPSEREVSASILDTMRHTSGRLIIATFASNVNRVAQIISNAIACGRKICVFGRSMINVIEIGRRLGTINAPDDAFVEPEMLANMPANKVCLICTGTQGEPLAALSRIANGTHRWIHIIPGDTVLFSSSVIPGNQAAIGAIINKLCRIGAIIVDNNIINTVHTTGHASSEEQKLMMQLTKPDYFMPMHGEYKMLKQHAISATETGIPDDHIFLMTNGDVLAMRNKEVFFTNLRIPTDAVYVDGNDTNGVAAAVLKDRKILADNGLVAVIVTIDSRYNKILCRPNIVSRGFVFIKKNQELLRDAEIVVYNALARRLQQKTTFGDLKTTIKTTLEPYFYQKTHRSPIIIPVILNMRAAMEQNAARQRAQISRR
ncbi:MAG: ribonuclease J [Erysipelotrichales bacterium]|nr:ribonuclease J [Erysipelotrichales bacterium]